MSHALESYHAMFAEYERLEAINRKAEQWMELAKSRAQYRRIADIGQPDKDYQEDERGEYR